MKVIKEAFKAFGGGFCGCLGAWAASLLLISTLGFIVGSVAAPIVPIVGGALPQILQSLQGLPSGFMAPMVGGYGPGQPPWWKVGRAGPFKGQGQTCLPQAPPLPSHAESVEGWWKVEPSPFLSKSVRMANPVGCGATNAGHDMPPGIYRVGVVVGQEVMASMEFTVE